MHLSRSVSVLDIDLRAIGLLKMVLAGAGTEDIALWLTFVVFVTHHTYWLQHILMHIMHDCSSHCIENMMLKIVIVVKTYVLSAAAANTTE